MKICVVGAGIIGTSSAIRLKQAFPDAELTLVSATFSPSTTSDGAGGLWQPHLLGETPKELVKVWARETFKLCEQLWRQEFIPELQGLEQLSDAVQLMPCYDLVDSMAQPDDSDPWKDTVYDYRWMNQDETMKMGFPINTVGHAFTTYTFEPNIALPIMYDWLRKQPSVLLKEEKLWNLRDLKGFYDFVINCSGVGAYYLVNDHNIKPISGHVLRVDAPWMKCTITRGEDVCIIPNRNSVVVGSINKFNNWDRSINDIDPSDALAILNKNADQLCPRLRSAKIIDQWVGLRPFRIGGVRLEYEHVDNQHVIHNYGHGGCGITLSWGCARHVVDIVKSKLSSKL